mmetsp:Transcript_34605/g.90621  ORF Transcript_34605/g.90621 Transcript_34605/m.90621 type:complete len:639 (+) Transcript_34605:172-2088(+)
MDDPNAADRKGKCYLAQPDDAAPLGPGFGPEADGDNVIVVNAASLEQPGAANAVDQPAAAHPPDSDPAWEIGTRPKPVQTKGFSALHKVAAEGDLDAVDRLIAQGHCVDVESDVWGTPLGIAVRHDRVDVARALIVAGADVDFDSGWISGEIPHISALHTAVARSSIGMVALLLDAGADASGLSTAAVCARIAAAVAAGAEPPQTPPEPRPSPLYLAAALGKLEMVKLLIDRGAPVDAPAVSGPGLTRRFLKKRGYCLAACDVLCPQVHQRFLDQPEYMYKEQWRPPLFGAASNGHLDVARYLVEVGAAVGKRPFSACCGLCSFGGTPVSAAADHGHGEVAKGLVAVGGPIEKPEFYCGACVPLCYGPTPLAMAAYSGHTNTVQGLAEVGASVDTRECCLLCCSAPVLIGAPLTTAFSKNRPEMAHTLINLGANLDTSMVTVYTPCCPGTSSTPLSLAVGTDNVETVHLALKSGADVKEHASKCCCPLALAYWSFDAPLTKAASQGNTEILELLLTAGADPLMESNLACCCPVSIDNAIGQAVDGSRYDMAKILLDNGADANQPFAVCGLPCFCCSLRVGSPLVYADLLPRLAQLLIDHDGKRKACQCEFFRLRNWLAICAPSRGRTGHDDSPDNLAI